MFRGTAQSEMASQRSFLDSKATLTLAFCVCVIVTTGAARLSSQAPTLLLKPYFVRDASGRNIRHIPCQNRESGQSGVCMFAWDCMKANGTHLGTCIDRFYFGSCCDLAPNETTHSSGHPTSSPDYLPESTSPTGSDNKKPSYTIVPARLTTFSPKVPQPSNHPADEPVSPGTPQFPIFIPSRPTLPPNLQVSTPQAPGTGNNGTEQGSVDGQGVPSTPQLGQPAPPQFPSGGNTGLPPPPQPQIPAVDQIPGSTNTNVPGQPNQPPAGTTAAPTGANDDSGASSARPPQPSFPTYPGLPSVPEGTTPAPGTGPQVPQLPNAPGQGMVPSLPNAPGGQTPSLEFPTLPTPANVPGQATQSPTGSTPSPVGANDDSDVSSARPPQPSLPTYPGAPPVPVGSTPAPGTGGSQFPQFPNTPGQGMAPSLPTAPAGQTPSLEFPSVPTPPAGGSGQPNVPQIPNPGQPAQPNNTAIPGGSNPGSQQPMVPQVTFPTPKPATPSQPSTEQPPNDPGDNSPPPAQQGLPAVGSPPSLPVIPPQSTTAATTMKPGQFPQLVISTLPPPSTLPPLNISSPAPLSTLPPPTFMTLPPLNASSSTTRPPPQFTTLRPLNLTTLPPPSIMTLPPLNISTLPPPTTLAPLNISTLPPPTVLTLPPFNFSTLPPPSIMTLPPLNISTLPPPTVMTLPPINISTLPPPTVNPPADSGVSVSTESPSSIPSTEESAQSSSPDPADLIQPSIVTPITESQSDGVAVGDSPSASNNMEVPAVPTVSINPTNVVPGISTASASLSSGTSSVPTTLPAGVTEMSSSLSATATQTSSVATLTTLSTILPNPTSLIDKNQTSLSTLFPSSASSEFQKPLATSSIPTPPPGFPALPSMFPSKPPSIPGIDIGVPSSTDSALQSTMSPSINPTESSHQPPPSSSPSVVPPSTDVENNPAPNPTEAAAAEPVTESQATLLPSTVESDLATQSTSGSTLVNTASVAGVSASNTVSQMLSTGIASQSTTGSTIASTATVAGSGASSTVSQMLSTGAGQVSETATSVAPTLSSSVSSIIPGIQGVLPSLTQAAQSQQMAATIAQSSLQHQQTILTSIQSQSSLFSSIGGQSTSTTAAAGIIDQPISNQTGVFTQLPSVIADSQTAVATHSTLFTSAQSQASIQSSIGSQATLTTAVSELVSSVSTATPGGSSNLKPTDDSQSVLPSSTESIATATASVPPEPSPDPPTLEPSSETGMQSTIILEPSTDTTSALPDMPTSSSGTEGLPDATAAVNDESLSKPPSPSGGGIFGGIPGIVGMLTSTVVQVSTASSTLSSAQTHSTVLGVVSSSAVLQNISTTVADQIQSQSSLSSHASSISAASAVTTATQVIPSTTSSPAMGVSASTQAPQQPPPGQTSSVTETPSQAVSSSTSASTTHEIDDFGVKQPSEHSANATVAPISEILESSNDTVGSTGLPEESFFTENGTLLISDYNKICGRRFFPTSRIVGGKEATYGKWPWQISLRQWRTSTYLHKCGAALLNENWAITAAHCVEKVPPTDLLLRIGEFDLSEEKEPYGYVERRVQIVATHPQFDARTFEYDLALLRFYEPVVFQPNIVPICVPDKDADYIGKTAYVTGWGRLYEDGPLPSRLQEVPVPIITNEACESMYRAAGYIEHIPNIFICAGWRNGGKDSCEGDSGGPMVLQRDEDSKWVLGGVISWGIGCAEPNQPGVYTRISEFRHWVNQILQF